MKNNEKMKNVVWVVGLVMVVIGLVIVGYGFFQKNTIEVKNPVVTMEVENYGTITLELYPEEAPETVKNFIALANGGFYNGLEFTRVVEDFMIQGGDPLKDGTGNAYLSDIMEISEEEDKEYGILGEFIANDVNNQLKFKKGTLGAARSDFTAYSPDLISESYNSGSSQFFIVTEDNYSINGIYAAFGKVLEGYDVLEEISAVEVEYSDMYIDDETGEPVDEAEKSKPVEPIVVTSISVETYGVEYGLPEVYDQFDYMSWLYSLYGIDPNTMLMY